MNVGSKGWHRYEGVVLWGQHLKVAAAHPRSSLVETLSCLCREPESYKESLQCLPGVPVSRIERV